MTSSMRGRAWLVTGAAGFIGGNFVRRLATATRDPIVILDALTYAGNIASIADVIALPHVTFVRGDICDTALLASLFETHAFDRVVHFAAESHVDRSILGPQTFVRTNVDGTLQLLEAARASWRTLDDKRFLHVSTDEVFGDLEIGAPGFNEDTPYRPSSPYAASKAASDHLVRAWSRTYDLPILVSNCSNNYGPWQFPEKLIPLMILNAIEGRPLPVYGDGLQRRDWLHVDDHCAALLTILERGSVGETYVIGGGDERPNIEIVHAVCAAVDAQLDRVAGTSARLIQHVTDRVGHDRRYAIDSTYLRTSLGWYPTHSIDSALQALVEWYVDHAEWCASVRSGAYRSFYESNYAERTAV